MMPCEIMGAIYSGAVKIVFDSDQERIAGRIGRRALSIFRKYLRTA